MGKEDCVPCRLNAGAAVGLAICDLFAKEKGAGWKVDCVKLRKEAVNNEITQLGVVEKMIETVDDPDVLADLKEVRRMMLGEPEPQDDKKE